MQTSAAGDSKFHIILFSALVPDGAILKLMLVMKKVEQILALFLGTVLDNSEELDFYVDVFY